MTHVSRRRAALVTALIAGLISCLPSPGLRAQENAPEPDGVWTGEMRGPVPATLRGGTVVDAAGMQRLAADGGAILIDVGPPPMKPEGLAPEAVWLPPPHRSIPGSVWLPGVGGGSLAPEREAWYRDSLAALSGGDQSRPLVFFCHPQCWGSWNAAKRAVLYGYRAVHWYPDGIEGWQDAGHPTAAVEAETPP